MINQMHEEKKLSAKLTAGRSGNLYAYSAILLVSVGKQNFEDEAIRSAIQMINIEFPECCIVMADTLQRYNIATESNVSVEEAYNISLQVGDEWLKRYEEFFISHFTVPYSIVRWDSIIYDSLFKEAESRFHFHLDRKSVV